MADTTCPCQGTGIVSGELCMVCHGHGNAEAYKADQEAAEAAKVPGEEVKPPKAA